MKTIRIEAFGGPEVMNLVDAADPKPGAGQVLVAVKAVGVNPVETYQRSGLYPRKPTLPWTPGADCAGVVEAVGAGVKLAVGARVYSSGTLTGAYAQKALCAETQLYPLPDKISFAQGAALGVPYGTAYRAIFERGRAQAGERVLIHGASGGVGTAALQLSKWKGLRAVGTASTPQGKALCLAQGAAAVFDHRAPDYEKELLAWTNGQGFDLVIEMLANVNLQRDLTLVTMHGRVVVVGNRGPAPFDARGIMSKDADVLGMSLHNAAPEDHIRIHAALSEGLRSGALAPVIAEEFPLAQARDAHVKILEAGARGKIVLTP